MPRLQNLVVRLDGGPLRPLLNSLYALGLRCMLATLARQPQVHSIYGSGSYFRGTHLCGHSDIDLCIVLREDVRPGDPSCFQVAQAYRRVQRWFPFLGGWDEKASNLVFLSEAADGFPLPSSFRVRLQHGRLTHLFGPPFDRDERHAVAAGDVLAEINTLLRLAVGTGPHHAGRLLFWKRLFDKLHLCCDDLGLSEVSTRLRNDPSIAFRQRADRDLFFTRCEPSGLFDLFAGQADHVWTALRAQPSEPLSAGCSDRLPAPAELRSLAFAAAIDDAELFALPSQPIGWQPHLFYVPIGTPIPVIRTAQGAYDCVRRLRQALEDSAEREPASQPGALVLDAAGRRFVLAVHPTYTDIVALDPLLHGNLDAALDRSPQTQVPVSVSAGQRAEARQRFAALAGVYERHSAWLPVTSYPCVYREDDRDTLDHALAVLRVYRLHVANDLPAHDADTLFAQLHRAYPSCSEVLDALASQWRFLHGLRAERPTANNLYRCLHELVAAVLRGDASPRIDPVHKHLGITVGIITRNRAADLPGALASLLRQSRRADEVVIVDNGSTDSTREVARSFEEKLPIRYIYLERPGIPQARNLVIETASQEIIAFTDDDAACDPDWLASIERGFLRADNVGIVGGWVEHWPAPTPSVVDTYYATFHSHNP